MLSLPDFPWDSLLPYRERASNHPDGLIDLSVGSPVDDTPAVAQQALAAASNAPSYPLTAGAPELILAMTQWWERRRNTGPLDSTQVLPTMGSKEMVGLLPTLLGLGRATPLLFPPLLIRPMRSELQWWGPPWSQKMILTGGLPLRLWCGLILRATPPARFCRRVT